jgi:hypothetical protein
MGKGINREAHGSAQETKVNLGWGRERVLFDTVFYRLSKGVI